MLTLSVGTKLAIKWIFIFALLSAFTVFVLAGSNYTLHRAVASTIQKEGFDLGTGSRLFILLDLEKSRFDVFGTRLLCEVGTVGHDELSQKYDLKDSTIDVKGDKVKLLQIENSDYKSDKIISDIQAVSNVAPNCKPLDSRNYFY